MTLSRDTALSASGAAGGGFDGPERAGTRSDGRKQDRHSADGCVEDRASEAGRGFATPREASRLRPAGGAASSSGSNLMTDVYDVVIWQNDDEREMVSCLGPFVRTLRRLGDIWPHISECAMKPSQFFGIVGRSQRSPPQPREEALPVLSRGK